MLSILRVEVHTLDNNYKNADGVGRLKSRGTSAECIPMCRMSKEDWKALKPRKKKSM